jgi:glucosamine--fructose-6-phosphate aminotransferase (isomerizing)
MNPDGFLADVLDEPATLDRVLSSADVGELRAEIAKARLVVLLGMGSSRFAALTAAARLRADGIAAVVEYASTDVPTRPGADVLAIGISATGNSEETVNALAAHHGMSRTVAITNAPDGGKLAAHADLLVPLNAGVETGGVACKTYQATLAVLLLAAGIDADTLRPAASAQQALLDTRGDWLDPLLANLDPARTTYMIAPAARISSALQSALMLREGPRVPAVATETGDWSHVDVYLSKHPNYTALLLPGSSYDAEALDWLTQRASRVITIGRPAPKLTALQHIPYNNAGDDLIASLIDVTVAELAAATWWRRRLDANEMP